MEENYVIDLTQSFIYCRAPTILNCDVIDLDDTIYASPRPVAAPEEPNVEPEIENETEASLPVTRSGKKRQTKISTGIKKKKRPRTPVSVPVQAPITPNYGDCPICHDPLGTNPMASTKCGHVYCIACISRAVKIHKKCPTCRKPLKGVTAFHPLFL